MSKRVNCLTALVTMFLLILSIIVSPANANNLERIGFYETPLLDKTPNRLTNIKLAAEKINGYVLNPQEIFSFNKVVGPRTKETGFKIAIIFQNKKMVEGYGGGICQLSSTIYQAALQAGLKVTEAHRHSLPVSYIARGKDATVSYGIQDLKFANNTEDKLVLQSTVTANKVLVEIYKMAAEEPVTIYIEDEKVQFSREPYFIKGTVYVPLRVLTEKMGFYVEWIGESQEIIIKNSETELALTIGSNIVTINGVPYQGSAAPEVRQGYTIVPIRFVAETFNKKVQWVNSERAVYITSYEEPAKEEPINEEPTETILPLVSIL